MAANPTRPSTHVSLAPLKIDPVEARKRRKADGDVDEDPPPEAKRTKLTETDIGSLSSQFSRMSRPGHHSLPPGGIDPGQPESTSEDNWAPTIPRSQSHPESQSVLRGELIASVPSPATIACRGMVEEDEDCVGNTPDKFFNRHMVTSSSSSMLASSSSMPHSSSMKDSSSSIMMMAEAGEGGMEVDNPLSSQSKSSGIQGDVLLGDLPPELQMSVPHYLTISEVFKYRILNRATSKSFLQSITHYETIAPTHDELVLELNAIKVLPCLNSLRITRLNTTLPVVHEWASCLLTQFSNLAALRLDSCSVDLHFLQICGQLPRLHTLEMQTAKDAGMHQLFEHSMKHHRTFTGSSSSSSSSYQTPSSSHFIPTSSHHTPTSSRHTTSSQHASSGSLSSGRRHMMDMDAPSDPKSSSHGTGLSSQQPTQTGMMLPPPSPRKNSNRFFECLQNLTIIPSDSYKLTTILNGLPSLTCLVTTFAEQKEKPNPKFVSACTKLTSLSLSHTYANRPFPSQFVSSLSVLSLHLRRLELSSGIDDNNFPFLCSKLVNLEVLVCRSATHLVTPDRIAAVQRLANLAHLHLDFGLQTRPVRLPAAILLEFKSMPKLKHLCIILQATTDVKRAAEELTKCEHIKYLQLWPDR